MDISAYQHMNIRMSTRGKRPLRNLTPTDKVRAIQRIHNGETKASVSRDIGVPESTLRGWCKNEQKLRFMCRQLDTDYLPLNAPPEKRLKFENSTSPLKIACDLNQDGLNYKRLHLKPLDLASNNAILEQIAFNDFFDKNNSASEIARKQLIGNSHILQSLNQASSSCELSHIAKMQNFSLLSFLNSNLAALQNIHAGTKDNFVSRNLLPVSSSMSDFKSGPDKISSGQQINTMNNSNNLSIEKTIEPQENYSTEFSEHNDNNNNSVKANLQLPSQFAPLVPFPNILSGHLPPYPLQTENTESSNPALFDWCKFFNACLNYIALSAAAAALQQPYSFTNKLHMEKSAPERTGETNMFHGLSKDSHLYPLFDQHLISSDNSNDSCLDSEPEDLSVRSTNSKISSATNSRSQSPTYLISSSGPSDAD